MGRTLIPGIVYHIDNIAAYLGKPIGESDWLQVTQEAIDQFARVTKDFNPLHVDAEWCAAHSPYKRTIAHGFLSLSLLSHFAYEAKLQPDGVDYGINYGFERVRFMAPVEVGQHIRMKATCLEFRVLGANRWLLKSRCNVWVKETGRAALSAVWSVLFLKGLPASMDDLPAATA